MTAPMFAAQQAADRIRDRRAAEGTLGKPQPVARVDALRTQTARILADAQARAHEPATGHGDRMEALISHAAETFDPETGTWRRPVRRWTR